MAIGAGSIVLDIFTGGASSIVKGGIKTGIKAGGRSLAKNVLKSPTTKFYNNAVKKGPRPNFGDARPHGNANHNGRIDNFIKRLRRNPNVSDIRKNQQQVDFDGYNVGRNRPDVQFDYDGRHYNIEWDHLLRSSRNHSRRINANDPNAVNKFFILKK